jgi:hypothetical protein
VQAFTPLDKIFDHAFNRAFYQSFNYIATYNDWELNYRFAGHNQPDQRVMNPNGRWYRECETGYYYSYFFGARSMVIDERFDYFSSGASFNVNPDGSMGSLSSVYQGRYVVRSYNTLLGFQTGGKLEYRFCRWTVDAHGNAGMYLNVASQESRIQTNIDGSTTDNPVSASEDVVAFAGGFGVAGSYKFLPNLTGHVAYDMLWVGDIARAPEQMVFSSMAVTAPEINTKGSVFYNGVTFGVELDW